MPATPTPRLGLPVPATSDPADVPSDISKLAVKLDANAVVYLQGTAAQRPAAGVVGRMFFATDIRTLYWDDGTAWRAPVFQPGDLRTSAAAAPSAGWLLCDGTAYLRADPTYAALYAVLGTTWGAGDGSTTFNVPDLRGRSLLGAGQGPGLTNRPLGSLSGEEQHRLINGEMPQHNHNANTGDDTPDHTHHLDLNTDATNAVTNSAYRAPITDDATGIGSWTHASGNDLHWGPVASPNHQGWVGSQLGHGHHLSGDTWGAGRHHHTINNDGGGNNHNNMPPYAAVSVFIKT